jgi:hypothetical protein
MIFAMLSAAGVLLLGAGADQGAAGRSGRRAARWRRAGG